MSFISLLFPCKVHAPVLKIQGYHNGLITEKKSRKLAYAELLDTLAMP